MNSADHCIERMTSITLDETMEQAALLRRLDTKYLAGEDDVADLLQRIGSRYRVLEIDSSRTFAYHSRYLDTPTLRSFRAHVQERRRRFKTRIREYCDSGERLIEVKTRGVRGETVKFRKPCQAGDIEPLPSLFTASCLAETYRQTEVLDLRAVLDVTYVRTTLVSKGGTARITLDRGVAFRELATGSRVALPASQWLVETKSANGRTDADRALLHARIRPVSLSKYVLGMALTRTDLHVNAYASTIARLHGRAVDDEFATLIVA